jgi:putative Ca2+/H+ antiporter (TMEM165/GDT1 family)
MDAFLVSTGIVGLADIGDKTQLVAFVLAARFRRQLPIVLGIFVSSAWPPGAGTAFGF